MDLPVRLQREPGRDPVISVDGAFGAPGLNLSHWPGNTTPADLRHALSTGSALAFARLSPEERARRAAGCVAIANNHLDTDGVCATWAVLHPEEALGRERELLAAAEAGDFFRVPSEAAFVIDCIVNGLGDPARSPIAAELAGLDDAGRHERAYLAALERLPALLDGAVEPYAALWRAPLEALRADLADLAGARRDELAHLELCVWTAAPGRTSSRPGAPDAFDPGRHALFGSTRTDRALVIGPRAAGATYRLIVNTTSWFDLPDAEPLPRPDLAGLAARLNALEGAADAAHRWRAQPVTNAAPELWFGAENADSFSEHAPGLRTSGLTPEVVTREVVEALRAVWAFPE